MNITFKQIEIVNFLSFKEEKFDFSDNRGINLICGINNDIPDAKNGAGKSNILNALAFCIFNKTINDIKKEAIPNRLVTDKVDCKVALNLEVDEVKYRIERSITGKAKNKVCFLFKFDEEKSEYVDITRSSIKETQKIIEKEIIKCDMSLFLRSILLTSDQSYNFFKLDSKDKAKFIEQIFDLSIFAITFEILHKDTLKIDKELYASQKELKVMQDQLAEYLSSKDSHDDKKKEKIKALESVIKDLTEKQKETTDNFGDFDKELSDISAQKNDIQLKINKLSDKLKQVNTSYHTFDKLISQNELTANQNKNLISKHEKSLSIICGECNKKFDELYKITELKNQIDECNKLVKENTEKREEQTKYSEKINVAIKKLQSDVKELEVKYNSIVSVNQTKRNAINKINSDISNNKFLLEKLNKEENPYIDSYNKQKDKGDKLEEKVTKYVDTINHYKYVEKLLEPDMIRKLILKDLIDYLNNRIHSYINKMGAKFTCVFNENLDYTFYTDSGETTYENFSSGERMRLSIATSFAFRDFMSARSGISANILVLDEYIDSGLDTSAIMNLMNILKDFSVSKKYDIFIVSHRREIQDSHFNNIITVEKTNGISTIKIEKN